MFTIILMMRQYPEGRLWPTPVGLVTMFECAKPYKTVALATVAGEIWKNAELPMFGERAYVILPSG